MTSGGGRSRAGDRPFSRGRAPHACVLGDIDLVSTLGLAGIDSVPVCATSDPAAYSRYCAGRLDPIDHWRSRDALVAMLCEWAATFAEPPVLYFQTDGDLLTVSRHRDDLGRVFRVLVADATLVEGLVDKALFADLAARLDLPVPRSVCLAPDDDPSAAAGIRFPAVVKPVLRVGLGALATTGKAVEVAGHDALVDVQRRAASAGVSVLVQELVDGDESRIETYHAYVDDAARVVAEFTGRKLRTHPTRFGHTTAAITTDAADVARAGRDVVGRLGLRGSVVKADFKRDAGGRLWLLEVNPRFNLWHHLGAVAGVNLPALVFADLTGAARPATRPARAGVRWVEPRSDRWAHASIGRWLADLLRADVRATASLRDPAPFVRGQLLPAVLRRMRGAEASETATSREAADAGRPV